MYVLYVLHRCRGGALILKCVTTVCVLVVVVVVSRGCTGGSRDGDESQAQKKICSMLHATNYYCTATPVLSTVAR